MHKDQMNVLWPTQTFKVKIRGKVESTFVKRAIKMKEFDLDFSLYGNVNENRKNFQGKTHRKQNRSWPVSRFLNFVFLLLLLKMFELEIW